MSKFVQLKLSRIQYGGDAIGNDIRIEIECLGSFLVLDKRMKNGSAVAVNAAIGQFFVDQRSARLPLNIRIIERDLIFNDVGSTEAKISIDSNTVSPQTSIHKIAVRELRGAYPGRSTAVFSVTVEALIIQATRYIPDTTDGWITALREDDRFASVFESAPRSH